MNPEVSANGLALNTWVAGLIFTVTWTTAKYSSSYRPSVYPQIPMLKF